MIRRLLERDDCHMTVVQACQITGVSRSGYYNYLKQAPARAKRAEQDADDFQLILIAYQQHGYETGRRGIYMRLMRMGKVMNVKKIARLMKENGLRCKYRRPNPTRRMMKALKTSTVAANILDRKFQEFEPRQCMLTDITYLYYYNGQVCYLSTILDVCTHEVLGYKASRTLMVEFVLETVDRVMEQYGTQLDDTVIVHSDQGSHYTSKAFIAKLRDLEFVQSMSRKGNCWDNAPQESFFGHMKDEISAKIKECKTFEEVEAELKKWMKYYNNFRYQWNLEKLAPAEYYQYRMTHVHPFAEMLGTKPKYQK